MKFKTKFDRLENKKWAELYPSKEDSGFRLTWSSNNYFDPRPQITTSLTSLLTIVALIGLPFINPWLVLLLIPTFFFSWGQIFIYLPFDSGRGNTAEYVTTGLNFYSVDGEFPNHLWIMGKNSKTIYMPWALNWFRTSYLKKDGTWFNEKKGNRIDHWEDYYQKQMFKETYDYTYTLKSGEKQIRKATITITEREWRRHWLPFTSALSLVRRVIDVEFDKEVGERSGSWKGGTVGCSYTLNKGETPLECLRRMERDRIFK